MSPSSKDLLELSEVCVQLSSQLCDCFRTERLALVQFNMDEMLHNNLLKEQLLNDLKKKRGDLREMLVERFGTDDWEEAAAQVDTLEKQDWREARAKWLIAWEDLRRMCERNSQFMRHSLRNLDYLAENLKRLFGLHSTYTAKGTRVDGKTQGGVVEGSY